MQLLTTETVFFVVAAREFRYENGGMVPKKMRTRTPLSPGKGAGKMFHNGENDGIAFILNVLAWKNSAVV